MAPASDHTVNLKSHMDSVTVLIQDITAHIENMTAYTVPTISHVEPEKSTRRL